jgi:peptidoglycan/xylan/chitin deacetylase (PgdA/CDA1 family)
MSETPGVRKPSLKRFFVRIAKLTISLVFFVCERAWRLLRGFAGARQSGTCVVLYYHSVPTSFRVQFENQMQVVSRLGKTVDLRSVGQLPAGSRFVAITFDDAMESFFENAVPVLLRLKIPATIFVVSDALGTKPKWGESYYAQDELVMSAHQLRSLPELIAVGSHTLTHPNLTTLSPELAAKEIANSREELGSLLQRQISLFSFPYGAFDGRTVCQCREAGYERVFTTIPVLAFATKDQYVVGRVSVDPWDWALEFRLKIMGAYRWDAAAHVATNRIRTWLGSERRNSGEFAIGRSTGGKASQ